MYAHPNNPNMAIICDMFEEVWLPSASNAIGIYGEETPDRIVASISFRSLSETDAEQQAGIIIANFTAFYAKNHVACDLPEVNFEALKLRALSYEDDDKPGKVYIVPLVAQK